MSPIATMRFPRSSDCGKHTVGNFLYKISVIVAKVRKVNLLIEGVIFFDLLEDSGNKHESQKEAKDYK